MTEGIQALVFSGHESFPLRFAWLTKAVRHVARDARLFSRDDSTVTLGVGKNMVRSIRHWALRSGAIEPAHDSGQPGEYRPTALGEALFGEDACDPFLEDTGTVWMIHWRLCSRPTSDVKLTTSPTTWYWTFNELRDSRFTPHELVDQLLRFSQRVPTRRPPSKTTVERDVACFLRSYVPMKPDRRLSKEETYDSPLTDLRLLRREAESDRFVLERDRRPTLPPYVFAFAVCEFWSRIAPRSDSLAFERIAYDETSPGQVFKLTENACVDLLELLPSCTDGSLGFDSTSGIRQLIRFAPVSQPLAVLLQGYTGIEARE